MDKNTPPINSFGIGAQQSRKATKLVHNVPNTSLITQSGPSSASNLLAAMSFTLPTQQITKLPHNSLQSNAFTKAQGSGNAPNIRSKLEHQLMQPLVGGKSKFVPPTSLTNLAQLSGITLVGPQEIKKKSAQSQTISSTSKSTTKIPKQVESTKKLKVKLNPINRNNAPNPIATSSVRTVERKNPVSKTSINTTTSQMKINETSNAIRNATKFCQAESNFTGETTDICRVSSKIAASPSIISSNPTCVNNTLSVNDLVKLVAILNNPALTITPVSSDSLSSASNLANFQRGIELTKINMEKKSNESSNNFAFNESPKSQSMPSFDQKKRHATLIQNIGGSLKIRQPTGITFPVQPQRNLSKQQSFSKTNEIIQKDMNKLSDPTMISTSVRNLMLQQPAPINGSSQNHVSAQLMQHIANHSREDWSSMTKHLETETIITIRPRLIKCSGIQEAKEKIGETTVSSEVVCKEGPKVSAITTRKRLFVPHDNNEFSKKPARVFDENTFNLKTIRIETKDTENKKVFVSDRHRMLHAMMNGDGKKRKKSQNEPDELFINRPKKIMSKIDTMIEKKKSKRFLRISGRKKPKFDDLALQCQESDAEWSDSERSFYDNVITTHLPLDEKLTDEKRLFMGKLNLISHEDKDKLLIERCEKKQILFSPLSFQMDSETLEKMKRLVNILLDSNGKDIQMRLETSIKRHELPLLEGLNRFTSRGKVAFMNSLGLDKRSKRTTLYKVGSNSLQHQNNRQLVLLPKPEQQQRSAEVPAEKNCLVPGVHNVQHRMFTNLTRLTNGNRQNEELSSCRAAVLKPILKSEFMKSLGLMSYDKDYCS